MIFGTLNLRVKMLSGVAQFLHEVSAELQNTIHHHAQKVRVFQLAQEQTLVQVEHLERSRVVVRYVDNPLSVVLNEA